ncbi:hypothetical protein AVEN_226677-1 [Araneus ventricosus]|uniref:Uncharacterized protein n=1 Tax=Araneus ventricosus TaxID=182803 RepID=A0A4Y2CZJ3_ARAVE|nr:hypothetical protein AVEN_226677-1 [Araneus ventricosus]
MTHFQLVIVSKNNTDNYGKTSQIIFEAQNKSITGSVDRRKSAAPIPPPPKKVFVPDKSSPTEQWCSGQKKWHHKLILGKRWPSGKVSASGPEGFETRFH